MEFVLCCTLVPSQVSLLDSAVASRADVALEAEVSLVPVVSLEVALEVAGIAALVRATLVLAYIVPLLLMDRLDVIVEVLLPVAHIVAALCLTFVRVPLLALVAVPATV